MQKNRHLEKIKKFHNWDAKQYKQTRYNSTSCEGLAYLTRQEIVMSIAKLEPGRVLDIGCGPGIFTPYLLTKDTKVFSSDLSIEMLRHAKKEIVAHPLATSSFYSVVSVLDMCYKDNVMDMIFCIGVVCYIDDVSKLLYEIRRVHKPGGRLIIQIDKIRFPKIYNKIVPIYQAIKSKITSKNYNRINFTFTYFVYKEFIRELQNIGYQIKDMQYYDFRIPFVDILFPKLSLKLGKMMFKKRNNKILRSFANGIIINAKKISSI